MEKNIISSHLPPYDFCTLQAGIDDDSRKKIEKASAQVDPSDFYFDTALPHGTHVTVLRGINPDLPKTLIAEHIPRYPIIARIKNSILLTPSTRPYNIVSLHLECDDLVLLNKRLAKQLNANEDFPFLPHISIGFVKKDKSKLYKKLNINLVGDIILKGFLLSDQFANIHELI